MDSKSLLRFIYNDSRVGVYNDLTGCLLYSSVGEVDAEQLVEVLGYETVSESLRGHMTQELPDNLNELPGS